MNELDLKQRMHKKLATRLKYSRTVEGHAEITDKIVKNVLIKIEFSRIEAGISNARQEADKKNMRPSYRLSLVKGCQ